MELREVNENVDELNMPQRVYFEAKRLVAEQLMTDNFLKKQ